VLTNPQELAMPPKTTFEQAYGFGLFMLRAVLNGHGSELVELAKTNIFR
jgi:pyruvate dehydrogenase (quinone)